MKNYIVSELIVAMKERIPRGINLVSRLTDALCMGKEAVYRRLRGGIASTFDEIVLASCKLGISTNQVIGNHQSDWVTFDLNLLHSPDPLESYYEVIERYLRIFNYVKDDSSTKIYTASNVIPFTPYSSYEYLSRFRLCRRIYQNGKIRTPNNLSGIRIPVKAVNAHKLLNEAAKACRKTRFIWDSNVFYSSVKEMRHSVGLNPISETDLMYSKNELVLLLHELEQMSAKGEFGNGNRVAIYLSNIDFETTCSYIEKKDFQVSLLRVYSINSMDSQSPRICGIQKDWIQSLKRHSILIPKNGEAQRISFLEQQKSFIDTL